MPARFVMSAESASGLENTGLPEVAFVGRSNVGKSSLIGKLLKRPSLVRTSRTPGRTQTLNLFTDAWLAYVDLPGYGYAKLSKTARAKMARMIQGYLTERSELCGVVQVLDARRESVTDDDRAMSALVLSSERPLLLAVSKSDLVPKNRRLARLRQIEKDMGVPSGTALLCSAVTADGLGELRTRLAELRP